jgi:ureidoacrylate peracid hydrolase
MRTAVLVIDMQNGFCHPDGSSAAHGMPLTTAPAAIAAIAELLDEARQHDVYRPGLVDMPERLALVWPRNPDPVVRGTWDAEIVSELAPHAEDHVVDKNRFDAFVYTDLEPLLRSIGVERLLVTGCITNICVETSVRSADQRGFLCLVAQDATAAFGADQDAALKVMGTYFATVGPWRELLSTCLESEVPVAAPAG